jgi:hypothetical protein
MTKEDATFCLRCSATTWLLLLMRRRERGVPFLCAAERPSFIA